MIKHVKGHHYGPAHGKVLESVSAQVRLNLSGDLLMGDILPKGTTILVIEVREDMVNIDEYHGDDPVITSRVLAQLTGRAKP